MKPTVGLIGLGLMGKPMGRNLLKAGFPLLVWNRTAARAEDLVREGARLGANPRETAQKADVLITIVSDPPALEAVLWGAEKGELVFMVGGEKEILERVKPVLEVLGKHIFLLGPNGAGQTVKLAMNLILALEVDALAEALALVTSAGLSGEGLVEVLQSSMGRSGLLDVKAPLMIKSEFPPSFPLRLMHKDMRLALELARQQGVTLPAATGAYAAYSAVKDASKDDPDYAAVARFWKR